MKKKVVGFYNGKRKSDGKDFVAVHVVGPASFPGFVGEQTEVLYTDPSNIPQGLAPGVDVELSYNIRGNKAYLNSISICK